MVILITGKSEMGRALEEKFKKEGHKVLVAEHTAAITELLDSEKKLDMLLTGLSDPKDKKDGDIISGPDWERAEALYEANVAGSLTAVQKAFPYLERGTLKRICYLNLAEGSVNASLKRDNYGLYMSACAVNMQVALLYNRMRKSGYTFRIFGMREDGDIREQAAAAYWYFTGNRSLDPESAKHTDENRLVMRDKDGREIPF